MTNTPSTTKTRPVPELHDGSNNCPECVLVTIPPPRAVTLTRAGREQAR